MKSIFGLFIIIILLNACTIESDPNNDREVFLGNWTCNEYQGDFAPQTYNLEIYAIGSGDRIGLAGLYNQGPSFVVVAEVSGSSLFISTQTVDGITIAGSGTIASNFDQISLNFSADDGSGNDQVKATLLR